ncbi:MAG TPA: hypothetical protein VI933_01350 [archaeon]|nr:hypothetical protein [archaeon]
MLTPPKSREERAKEKGFYQCENCGNYYDDLEFSACPKCNAKRPPSILKILLDKIFFWIKIFRK